MKKLLCIVLSAVFLISAAALPVSAQKKEEIISVEFKSNIGGLSYLDSDKLAVIRSDNIVLSDTSLCDPVTTIDHAGSIYEGELKPGRTYCIQYYFDMKPGHEIPDELNENNVVTVCDSGCTVHWYGITQGMCRDGRTRCYHISFYTEVTVDGNLFQRIFGRIADWFLKLRAWSPY